MSSKQYDSDLTDAEFAILEPLLPARKAMGRPRSVVLREILDAIFYVLRGGAPARPGSPADVTAGRAGPRPRAAGCWWRP